MINISCQINRDKKVSGENANTIVNKNANHQVLRQFKFSRASNPSKARTNQGPITKRTTVPSLPELIPPIATGAKA